MLAIIRDITERKRSEEALREPEELFRSVFDNASVGVAVVGLDGRFRQVNRALCEILGYSEEGLLATTIREITHPEDLGASMAYVRRVLEGELDKYSLEKRYIGAGGRISVVMVTMQDDPDYLFEAVIAGAAGYVLKGATPDQLTEAVRQVLNGEFLLDQRLTIDLLKSMAERQRSDPPLVAASNPELPLEPLTPRETEILQLLARGATNPQIAQELVVSPGTVKNHVRHIITKLGVSDRTQAAVRAVELGLLTSHQQRTE